MFRWPLWRHSKGQTLPILQNIWSSITHDHVLFNKISDLLKCFHIKLSLSFPIYSISSVPDTCPERVFSYEAIAVYCVIFVAQYTLKWNPLDTQLFSFAAQLNYLCHYELSKQPIFRNISRRLFCMNEWHRSALFMTKWTWLCSYQRKSSEYQSKNTCQPRNEPYTIENDMQ